MIRSASIRSSSQNVSASFPEGLDESEKASWLSPISASRSRSANLSVT